MTAGRTGIDLFRVERPERRGIRYFHESRAARGHVRNDSFVGNGLGGADRDRTDDLRLAKPALSQLSYSPE
jgi:hypothetical protein